jgi:5-methylcytosine-specific restriction enzyme subunit McrC
VSNFEWTSQSPSLRITENASVLATSALIDSIRVESFDRLGLRVTTTPNREGWTVTASDYVGVGQIKTESGFKNLTISSKVQGLDTFFLADWAFGGDANLPPQLGERALLEAMREEPAACMLGWYLRAINHFSSRWFRRDYLRHELDLIGSVRGKVDLPRYVSRSLSGGTPHIVPCKFDEPSHDSPLNQFLRAGVVRAGVLVNSVPIPQARLHLRNLCRQAISHFGDVSERKFSGAEFRRFRLNGPRRHYRQVVMLTAAILQQSYISPENGSHSQEAFFWSVNAMFEDALRQILRSAPGILLEEMRAQRTIRRADGSIASKSKVRPDYIVRRADGSRVILDAKYKQVIHAGSRDTSDRGVADNVLNASKSTRIRVRPSDVYQAVSYSRHAAYLGSRPALVYPVVLAPGEELPPPMAIPEYDPEVRVAFVDVGRCANENIARFYSHLDSI